MFIFGSFKFFICILLLSFCLSVSLFVFRTVAAYRDVLANCSWQYIWIKKFRIIGEYCAHAVLFVCHVHLSICCELFVLTLIVCTIYDVWCTVTSTFSKMRKNFEKQQLAYRYVEWVVNVMWWTKAGRRLHIFFVYFYCYIRSYILCTCIRHKDDMPKEVF